MGFKTGPSNWTEYRKFENVTECDFHTNDYVPGPYAREEALASVESTVINALKEAQNNGKEWVLFTHGSSTSRRGRTTKRSVLRKFMSSREASQYIIKKESYQDESVFMARVKPLSKTK